MRAMEPRIQYAKTSDGVSIAYWTVGEGPPLVVSSGGISHCQLDWTMPEHRSWYQALARHCRVVSFDGRGVGLSDRQVPAPGLQESLLDLKAVVDRLGLDSFTLFAPMHAAPVGIAYGVAHPEHLSKLILWSGYASFPEWGERPTVKASRALIEYDWEFATNALAHRLFGWSAGGAAGRYAAVIRESVSREFLQDWISRVRLDVASLVNRLLVPTLVLQRRDAIPGLEVARSLAARIPNASLAILDGDSAAPYLGDMNSTLAAIEEFLGVDGTEMPAEKGPVASGMSAILFADIADSTALTERLGDAAFREKARDLDNALRTLIREQSGTPIEGKLLGDGVLAVFTSARQGIEAALACGRAGGDAGLLLHLGLHAGDVIREEGNVFGGAVNIAARISGLSAPGEVLVSETVRSLARTSAGVRFEDRGEQALKGVGEPVRVWAVREAE